MVAAVVAPPQRAGRRDGSLPLAFDDYRSDCLELARVSEELQAVVSRVQERLSADGRRLVAEREVVAAERAAAAVERECAERAVRAVEQAAAALALAGREGAAAACVAPPPAGPQSAGAKAPPHPPQRRLPQEGTAAVATAVATDMLEGPTAEKATLGSRPAIERALEAAMPSHAPTGAGRSSSNSGLPRYKEPPGHQKRPPPPATSSAAQVPGNDQVLVKEPPVQPAVKVPPCHAAKQQPASPPVSKLPSVPESLSSAQGSLPSAPAGALPTPPGEVAEKEREKRRFEERDVDEESGAACSEFTHSREAEGPPNKAPPPQASCHHVMPQQPEAEQLDGSVHLLPAAAAPLHKVVPEGPSVQQKAMPTRAPPKSMPAPSALHLEERSEPREPQQPEQRQPPEDPPQCRAEPLPGAKPSGVCESPPAKASAAAEAPVRGRYKAPPLELATALTGQSSSGGPPDQRESDDAWGGWRGTSSQRDPEVNSAESLPLRMKAPPSHVGAPAPSSCPPRQDAGPEGGAPRMKAPPMKSPPSVQTS